MFHQVTMEEIGIEGKFPILTQSAMNPIMQNFRKTPNSFTYLGFLTPPSSEEALMPTNRVSETPRTHWNKQENTLSYNFKEQCIIYCDTPIQNSGYNGSNKRFRRDIVVTPKKQIKPIRVSFKDEEKVQEQKENSPIKIEIETEAHAIYANKALNFCSLTLKPPPIKYSSYIFLPRETSCDIISGLAEKGLVHVLQRIFNNLDPIDLVNIQFVSRHYHDILSRVVSKESLGSARSKVLKSKENIGVRLNRTVKMKNETTPIKLFRINKQIQSPKRRAVLPPQLSPNSKRFQYFVQTAKTLGKSETLEKCPHCRYPAKRNESVATCSSCKYSFCVQCRSQPHLNSECNFFIPSPESPGTCKSRHCGIGTKANKKALRRLI